MTWLLAIFKFLGAALSYLKMERLLRLGSAEARLKGLQEKEEREATARRIRDALINDPDYRKRVRERFRADD